MHILALELSYDANYMQSPKLTKKTLFHEIWQQKNPHTRGAHIRQFGGRVTPPGYSVLTVLVRSFNKNFRGFARVKHFAGNNFRGLKIRKICEHFLPRKFVQLYNILG